MNKQQLYAARLTITHFFPFFSSMCSLIRFHEVPGLNTFACDSYAKVYYDPSLDWAQEEVNLALLHEVCHLVRFHNQRGEHILQDSGALVPDVWNWGTDCEINGPLAELCEVSDKFQFRHGYGVFPSNFQLKNGLLAEQYYDYIMEQNGLSDHVKKMIDHLKEHGPDCGSASGGDARGYEVRDHTDPSDDQLGKAAKDASRDVKKWSKSGGPQPQRDPQQPRQPAKKGRWRNKNKENDRGGEGREEGGRDPGTGGGDFDLSSLPAILSSKMWLDRMRKTVNEFLRLRNYGYARPNRRYRNDPFILPGNRNPAPPFVAMIVDVSGSIMQRSAHQAFKLGDQLTKLGIRVRVVACDDGAIEVRVGDAAYGGGGTRLVEGFNYINENFPRPDVCLVISDGECWDWGDDPGYPVVMFTWSQMGPAWMKHVSMPVL